MDSQFKIRVWSSVKYTAAEACVDMSEALRHRIVVS